MISLLDINEKQDVRIEEIVGSEDQQERLSEIGFIPGSLTSLIAKLPFNGPLACKIRGTKFALRREDAQCILVSAA